MPKPQDDQIEKLVEEGRIGTVEQALEEKEEPSTLPQPEAFPTSAAEGIAAPAADDQLAKLRAQVPPHYISSLPKETKKQKEEREKDRSRGIRCALCGGWHHRDAQHVPYVGHAAVTDRLLSVDPYWSWEPVAWTPEGLPRFDASGGMWIRLTVAGMTRLGYGHAAQKSSQDPGAREKEVIGDALRNAAMRFGVALELWHKGELHADEDTVEANTTDDVTGEPAVDPMAGAPEGMFINDEQRDRILSMAASAGVEARAICDRYGIDSLPQLHADAFDGLMQSLRMTAEKRAKGAPMTTGEASQSDQLGLDDDVPY